PPGADPVLRIRRLCVASGAEGCPTSTQAALSRLADARRLGGGDSGATSAPLVESDRGLRALGASLGLIFFFDKDYDHDHDYDSTQRRRAAQVPRRTHCP